MKIKPLIGLLASCCALSLNSAVVVKETVSFDTFLTATANDYTRNFSPAGGYSSHQFVQIVEDDGSGVLSPALFGKQASDPTGLMARFKYSFHNTVGATFSVSVDFKLDRSIMNPFSEERAVGIVFLPTSSGAQPISASINLVRWANPRLYLWGWGGPDAQMSDKAGFMGLADGWHRLEVHISTVGGGFGDEVRIVGRVSILPSQRKVVETQIVVRDRLFAVDSKIAVGLYATKWGGTAALDNFVFDGPTSDAPGVARRYVNPQVRHAVEIVWPSINGRHYVIESAATTTGTWHPLTGRIAGNGADMSHFVTRDNRQKYFRVRED